MVKGKNPGKPYSYFSFFPNTSTTLVFDTEIDIAPNVLNIQSESVVVTVHTDIVYSAVIGSSVFFNGVAINHWKADAQGNFVANKNSQGEILR